MKARAVEMRDKGYSAEEIIAEMAVMKKKISTSFITKNPEYLYRNGRVNKTVRDICV